MMECIKFKDIETASFPEMKEDVVNFDLLVSMIETRYHFSDNAEKENFVFDFIRHAMTNHCVEVGYLDADWIDVVSWNKTPDEVIQKIIEDKDIPLDDRNAGAIAWFAIRTQNSSSGR
jgi:hypothetical protein